MSLPLVRATNLLGDHTGDKPVAHQRGIDVIGQLLADLGSAVSPHEVLALLQDSLKRPVRFVENPRACLESASAIGRRSDGNHVSVPVKMGNVVRGRLIVDSGCLTPLDLGLLILAGRVLAACLWEQEPTGQIWNRILNCDQVSTNEIQRAFALRGWPPICTVSVFAARAEPSGKMPDAGGNAPRAAAAETEEHWGEYSDILEGRGHRVVFSRGDLFALFVSVEPDGPRQLPRLADEIRTALGGSSSDQVTIGIGGMAGSLSEVPLLWKRAYDVLRWGEVFLGRGVVVPYEMLGMLGALLDHVPASALQDYVESRLQPLLAHDARAGTDLYRTLVAFVECGGNRVETARRLFIHYNTLRHRLRRIEELVGVDLSRPASSLDLSLCVHISSLCPIAPRKE